MFKKLVIFFAFLMLSKFIFAQASWEQFGQNRVQYRTFEWSYFDSTHFRTFYYDQGKATARYAINMAEQELQNIVYLMGGKLNKKLNIIIYNTFSDYRQTNLGRKNETINDANSGKVEIIDENIPVYFNGDHNHLKKQIIKGISNAIKDNMLFGDNIKEIVKNAVKMNLSDWYTNGYVSFISTDWTPEMQAEAFQLIQNKPTNSINEIATQNPSLIGHSFWRYISKTYGESQISNLLYLTRYRKNINNSIQIVFKKPYKDIFNDWKQFYSRTDSNILNKKDTFRILLAKIPIEKDIVYSNISVSPTTSDVAYVEKKDGQFSIKILNVKYNKIYTVLDGGIRANKELLDPDYPLISWSPSGRKVSILYVKKNKLNIRVYTTGNKKMENKIIPNSKIDRITGMCFMEDDNSIAITGIKKGASDLFKLTLKNNRVENITKDLFDDKNPVVLQTGSFSGILFLSNRTSNYIGDNSKSDAFNEAFNLFLYQPQLGNNLIQLSNTNTEIKFPMQWGIENISYLTDENNLLVRKIVKLEKRLTQHDTFNVKNASPLPYNTLKQEYIHNTSHVVELTKDKNEYAIYSTPHLLHNTADTSYANSIKNDTSKNNVENIEEEVFPEYETAFENDSSSTILESIFLAKKNNTKKYEVYTEAISKIKTYNYKTSFTPDFLQTTLDNTLLFSRYQVFDQQNQTYQNPSLSGFLTSTLTDVMEDHKLTLGARLGVNFTSVDYFLKYNNYRKRTDIELLFFHHSNRNDLNDSTRRLPYQMIKEKMDILQAKFTYPFSIMSSLSFTTAFRYDRKETLAIEDYSLKVPQTTQFWSVSRLEYIHDNSISPIINIFKGSRYKVFAEYQYKISNPHVGFYNVGYDARKYSTLIKNVILASRIVGAMSGGNGKILYKVGGVDNDLSPMSEATTQVDYSQNYAFQAKATNVRGYKNGFLNGNSYLIINEEIRLPVYNTFFKRNIKSGFIKNLQIIAFADFGTAWKGFFPNAENVVSNAIYSNTSVKVFIENTYAFGYGTGLRSKILGYFLRADFAWHAYGTSKPTIHLSMATDF